MAQHVFVNGRAVRDRLGTTRSGQLGTLVRAMIRGTADTGRVGMTAPEADALDHSPTR